MNANLLLWNVEAQTAPVVRNKTWVFDMIWELGLYLSASPRSRYWQLQQLRELDAERLDDLGITPEQAKLRWQANRTVKMRAKGFQCACSVET